MHKLCIKDFVVDQRPTAESGSGCGQTILSSEVKREQDIKQIELAFADESRAFFYTGKCPSCGHSVFVSKDYHPKIRKALWTVGCNGPDRCYVTNPVSDQRTAVQQFRMISTLVK